MIGNTEKLAFGGIVVFNVFWLFIEFMMGEGIIFGHRYFDNVIRTFSGLEIILFIASFVFIYKNTRIGYLFLAIALVTNIIFNWGHRLGIYECSYCQL